MIKGLAITPPVQGRISIGRVVERNGKRLPEKDDQFTITSQVQNKDGWVPHPMDTAIRKASINQKIRTIPIRLLFDDPDLNLRAEYSLFDRTTGRPMCVGNGETCKRVGLDGIQQLACPSPEGCELGKKLGCKPYGRLHVRIGEEDPLACFIFRTTGFNSIRTLSARLQYFKAVSGNNLSCMPLELKLRAKSTTQSHRAPVYYVDMTLPENLDLAEAVSEARANLAERSAAGIDQAALEEAARSGYAQGSFEETEEDVPEIVEEFYPETITSGGSAETGGAS